MRNYLDESEVQQRIVNDKIVQNGIISALEIDSPVEFIREDMYINGITADFTVVVNNCIRAIIECKSGNINVTDYVRGIGQLLQYEYYQEKRIPHKSYDYSENFDTIYLFPSSVVRKNSFNIARFKYPQTTMILELNECNNAVRKITKKELRELEVAEDDNLVTISQYYFRDNRLFEYYILLKYLLFLNQLGKSYCDRKVVEQNFLVKIQTINNGNWRNAFITLSNLGLIDNNNMPTEAGKRLAICSYEKFAVSMYHSYLKPYVQEFLKCFQDGEKLTATNQEISSMIKINYCNRDVLYVTQSNGRYISSWMNIFRDDYGFIDFQPRSAVRLLKYNPLDLNDEAFERKIRECSIAYDYIKRYIDLISGGY